MSFSDAIFIPGFMERLIIPLLMILKEITARPWGRWPITPVRWPRKFWSSPDSPMILSRPEGWEWPLVLFTVLRQYSEIFTAFFLELRKNRRYKESEPLII